MNNHRKKILVKFLSYLKPFWFQELVTLVVIVATSIAALSSPYFLKIIIDDVLPSSDYESLVYILGLLLMINVGRISLSLFSDYLYEWINNKVMMDLRKDLYAHVIALPLSFFNETSTGDIVYRVNNEVNKIQSILTGSLLRLIQSTILIIGITIALCLLNWQLFLASMVIMPVLYFNIRLFHPKIVRWTNNVRSYESSLLNTLIDKIDHVKLIKSFGRYNYEINYLSGKIQQLIKSNLKYQLITSSSKSISTFLVSISPLLVLLVGGRQVMQGTMTLGALIAFIQYLNRIFNPFKELMGLYMDMTKASVSMRRMFDYFEIEKEHRKGLIPSENGQSEDIVFKDITFLRDEVHVLKNLNLLLKPGKKYAIVGSSGCGKSTLLDLLCRFEHPQSGAITYGGKAIQNIDLDWWRKKIAQVSQESQLFNQDIQENLRYGNIESVESDMDQAIALTGLTDKINQMPLKYQSMIGGHGTKLSGGQIQRLAISRAILKEDSDILVFDEATSALDSETERYVIEGIMKNHSDKTIIMVSHRLSTIQCADHIICLDGGTVVEQGRYDELLMAKGFFVKLFAEQIHLRIEGNGHDLVHDRQDCTDPLVENAKSVQ